jgi:bifunctional non-homologous end joining protein LigD
MGLNHYWQKRNFNITPEPAGDIAEAGETLAFYIQRHHARRLHYDFRLELDGVLKSWAIPKGPTLDPKEKRLAVHVEDHPLEYGHFEGQIPAHQYGAGQVVLWDCGTWEPLEDPHVGYEKGALKFMLHGEKLSGKWALVRMGKKAAGSEKENWLLIKEKDEVAQSGEDANITEHRPESIRMLFSGDAHRPLQRAGDARAAAKSRSASHTSTKPRPAKAEKRAEPEQVQAMPATMQPQLALLAKKAPIGEHWLTEVKFDGYRMLARCEQGEVKLYSRNGHDWTGKWLSIAEALQRLPVDQAWLDGELVALQPSGKVSFQALQDAMQANSKATLAYFVFDLMYLNGHDLRSQPLIKRKALLKTLLDHADADSPEHSPLQFSDHIVGNAPEVFDHACLHDLEGVIAKRADSLYQSRRSEDWLKIKCGLRQEFVIGGYTDPAGSRQGFGALLLGVYDADGNLHYAGRVGTGFTETTLSQLSRQFPKLQRNSSPFAGKLTGLQLRGVHWLTPKLVGEVRFAQWTDSRIVRHAAFVGLREDKPARDIVQENPVNLPAADETVTEAGRSASKPAPRAIMQDIAGIRLTHPGKVLFAKAGVTKQDLALYYEAIAPWILPHLQGRPLSLVRCPSGAEQQCFFQKHAATTIPDNVRRIQVPVSGFSDDYMVVEDVPALISLVQMGVLELHTWGSREGHLEQPDRIIFDLDPDETLPWTTIVESAQLVRALLQALSLESFIKTTGGKGIHVEIPIVPEHDWATIKAFSKAVAQYLEKQLPDRFTANMAKEKRKGKVFIDYLRNAAGATAIAAYSSRAKPGATVSIPISWDELNMGVRSDTFTVLNVPQRLANLQQDPWQDYEDRRQHITTAMLEMFT